MKPHKPKAAAALDPDDPESQPLTRYQRSQRPKAAEDPADLAFSVAGKLALVVALIFACAAVWRRVHGALPQLGPAQAQAINVTSTVALGPQRFLHLVSVGRRHLLLASTPQSISLLAALDGTAGMSPTLFPEATATDPQTEEGYSDTEPWTEASDTPADRFEELLVRLRELEADSPEDQAPGSRPARAAGSRSHPNPQRFPPIPDGSRLHSPRGPEPASRQHPVLAATHASAAGVRQSSTVQGSREAWISPEDRPLTPGALFLSSARAREGSGDG